MCDWSLFHVIILEIIENGVSTIDCVTQDCIHFFSSFIFSIAKSEQAAKPFKNNIILNMEICKDVI